MLTALAALCAHGADFPPLMLEHLTVADGLTQGDVLATLQDSQGFMWLGTEDGLMRYDGRDFFRYAYQRAKPGSLPGNYVQRIVEDAHHDLWIALNDAGIARWNRATDKFTTWRHDPHDANSLSSDAVGSVLIDGHGLVWIGTRDAGIDILDPGSGQIRHLRHSEAAADTLIDDRILTLAQGSAGSIWVGTEAGLDKLQATGPTSFQHFRHTAGDPNSPSSDAVSQVVALPDGSLWLGTLGGGIDYMDATGRVSKTYRHDPQRPESLANDDVRAMLQDRQGRLWVGTIDGLDLLDGASGSFTHYRHDDRDPASLRDSYVVSLYEDGSGLLWIGTREGGVSRWNPHGWELGGRRPEWLAGRAVTAFADAPDQKLWIASMEGGLLQFDPSSGRAVDADQVLHKKNPFGSRRVMALRLDRNRSLWVGLMDDGLRKVRPDGVIETIAAKPHDPHGLSAPAIMSIYEALDGKLWIGTHGGGANILDPASGIVTQLPYDASRGALSSANVTAFAEDHEGGVWIGTQGGGVDLARRDGSVVWVFRHDENQPGSISSNTVFAVSVDDNGKVWIATEAGGLEMVHGSSAAPDSIRFDNFSRSNDLSSDTIYAVLPDAAGRLWMSGNAGLMRFDPRTRTVKTFHVEQGAQGEEFDFGAWIRLPDGRLGFGGPGGFNVFDPVKLTETTQPPRLALTRVEVLGVPLASATPYWLLTQIDVDSHASILSLDFGAFDFTSAKRNRLSYRVSDLTERWIDLGAQRRVTLTNLDAGDHVLEVRGASADSGWSRSPLRLTIHRSPAPWKSAWAILGYAAAFICLVGYAWWQQRRKIAMGVKTQLRLEAEVAARTADLLASNRLLEEAARVKGDFLARMTHELRTPMNGVVGMTELLERTPLTDEQTRLTKVIRSSADLLLQIVNELLDLSKAQAGKIELEILPIDLGSMLEESAALFAAAAAAKGLDLAICPPQAHGVILLGDPLRIRQILINLIGNAVKFTDRGQVVIEANIGAVNDGRAAVEIVVADSGIGMSEISAGRIFEPFTKADESTSRRFGGTGLGLAICRELVTLMGGSITVASRPGAGSTFRVALTLHSAMPAQAEPTLRARVRILTHQTALHEGLGRHAANFGLTPVETDTEADFAIVDVATHAAYLHSQGSSKSRLPVVLIASPEQAGGLEALARPASDIVVSRPLKRGELFRACQTALGSPLAPNIVPERWSITGLTSFAGHVLVVDDEPVNAAVAQGYLAALGCTSVWVEEGAAALARTATERFDLILMDVSMPGMDGFETTRLIRARETAAERVPIVALTAHDSQAYLDRCLAAGMDDLLEKPYSLENCAAVLRGLVPQRERAEPAVHPETAAELTSIDGAVVAAVRSLSPRAQGDLYRKLVGLFGKSSTAELAHLRGALERQDLGAAAAICHKLKASADNVGASSFAEGLRELERRCHANDVPGCRARFASLDASHPALLDELERYTLKASA